MAQDTSLNLPYLLITGVAIAAAIVVILILRPLLSNISTTQDKIAAQTVLFKERQEFLRAIDRKLSALGQQKVHEDRLAVMLPAVERMEDSLRVVHRAAETAGLTITTINNTSSTAQTKLNASRARGQQTGFPENITPLAFAITSTGSYQQYRVFITELERSPRLMDVGSLRLRRNETNPDQITGQMTVIFYMQEFDLSS